jgi:hypothetical protein
VVPVYDVSVDIDLPAGENCGYPTRDEISEEGFGYFRGTWWIGPARLGEAREAIAFERDVVEALDLMAPDEDRFDVLARRVENLDDDDDVAELAGTPLEDVAHPYLGEGSPLHGLELGVAGLTYALSALGFRTAASCRGHRRGGWTDCPVVLFGGHRWRAVILAGLAGETGCGIGQDRGMLTVYGPSIRQLIALAQTMVEKRGRFKAKPGNFRSESAASQQPTLGL